MFLDYGLSIVPGSNALTQTFCYLMSVYAVHFRSRNGYIILFLEELSIYAMGSKMNIFIFIIIHNIT